MKFVIFMLLASLSTVFMETIDNTDVEESPKKILSRTKRFIVFPDGSSFQLVFCTQNHGYLQVGDIVWFGNTAALAWELPNDPQLFYMFKKEKKFYDDFHRRKDTKHVVYLDENGKVLSTVPYKKKFIASPIFAKRSIEDSKTKPISIRELHENQKNRTYLFNIDESSTDFHRQGRKSFYAKLETFFKSLGYSGKDCVHRMLCESARMENEQGSFLQEIMRATFTFPKSTKASEADIEYDVAHRRPGDCATLYPGCKDLHGHLLYKH